MTLTRRAFLTSAAGALGLAAVGTAGCSSPVTTNPGGLTLWYSKDGLTTSIVNDAVSRFTADRLQVSVIGDGLKHRLLAAMSGDAYVPDITMVGDDVATYFQDSDRFVDLNTLGADKLK